MNFGEKLNSLMRHHGTKAATLAEGCVCKDSTVENWKRSTASPTFQQVLVVQRLYAVDLEWLIDAEREEWPPPRPLANDRAAVLTMVADALSSAAKSVGRGLEIEPDQFEGALDPELSEASRRRRAQEAREYR